MRTIVSFLLLLMMAATAAGTEKKVFTATTGTDGVQRAEVLAGRYYFNPNHIIVKVNVPVELSIRKEAEIIPHSFVMQSPEAGMNFHESLSSEPKIVRFTPKKTGAYPFFCDKKLLFFPSHRQEGMEGTIEVVQ